MAGAADGSFAAPAVVKTSADFVCVRGTQKYATHFRIKAVPAVLFTDPDGDEIHRAGFSDAGGLEGAMKAALQKYQNRPVSWKADPAAASSSKKLLVVGFEDETGQGLKLLEDRSVVKYHDRCEFVKLPADAARAWGVTAFPAIVLCDPAQEPPSKAPLEKLTGRKSVPAVKAALQRALARLDARK